MLVGHVAVGFAAKRVEPKVSLGTLVLAPLLADLLWCLFMLVGIERVQLKPGRGAANYLVAAEIGFSHSLLACAFWGALLAAGYFLRRRHPRGAFVLFVGVLSHWLLDFVAHRPDMPLAPGAESRLGLGLWSSVPATLVVEGGLWLLAIILYVRATRPKGRAGTYVLWAGVILVTPAWYNSVTGPPPPSPVAMGVGSLVFFSLVVAWAYWLNRLRPARDLEEAALG